MFAPKVWAPQSEEDVTALIAAHPMAALVTTGDGGLLASRCPMELDCARGRRGTLIGHLARANPHWRDFAAGPRALVMFQGPNSYVSPSFYPGRDMAPTWYYTVVHAYGEVRLLPDLGDVRAHLLSLVNHIERDRVDRWNMSELGEDGVARRLRAVVAFEIEIDDIVAKFKLGQDEPLEDALAAAKRLEAMGDPASAALAEMVRTANAKRAQSLSGSGQS